MNKYAIQQKIRLISLVNQQISLEMKDKFSQILYQELSLCLKLFWLNNIIMRKNIINGNRLAFISLLFTLFAYQAFSKDDQCPLNCVQTDKGCKVCFKTCSQDNSTTLFFSSCTQSFNNLPAEGDSSHNKSTTIAYGIVQCGTNCCDARLQVFQNPVLTSCPITSSNQIQITIIVIITLTTVFVAVCCIVSGNSKIREKIIECLCKEKVQARKDVVANSLSLSNIMDLTPAEQRKSKKPFHSQFCDQICSICLEEGSNISTHCGHPYHFKCLYQWTMRKEECPMCKTAKLKRVFVFCQKCHQQKAQIVLRQIPYMQMKNLETYKCQECRIK